MSEEVKMTKEEIEQEAIKQEAIKNEWKTRRDINGINKRKSLIGEYKIGEFKYYNNESKECKPLNLASIDDATKLCDGVLDEGLFFDDSNGFGNFHFAPNAKELNEIKIFDIYQNLCKIQAALSIKLEGDDGMKASMTKPGNAFKVNEYNKYNDYKKYVFAYNRVNLGDVVYDMTGVRFSKEKDKDGVERISCSIGELQMMRILPTKTMGEKKLKSVYFYPNTINEHEDIDQLITTNYNENKDYFYYNPELTIYDNVEDIAKIFIDFINKCEEKYKDK